MSGLRAEEPVHSGEGLLLCAGAGEVGPTAVGMSGSMLFPEFSCQHAAPTGLPRTRARPCHTVHQPVSWATVTHPALHTQALSGGFQLRPELPCPPHLLLAPLSTALMFPKSSFSPRTSLAARFDLGGNIWPAHLARPPSPAPQSSVLGTRVASERGRWLRTSVTMAPAQPLGVGEGQPAHRCLHPRLPGCHAPHRDSFVGVHCGPRTRWGCLRA